MKILSAAVLALLLLQQASCTHFETCECHEIRALVNETVEQTNARLESKIIANMNATVEEANTWLETKVKDEISKVKDEIFSNVNATAQEANTRLETEVKDEISKVKDEILSKVNVTVQEAIARLESKFDAINLNLNETSTLEELLQPIQRQLNYHLQPPPASPLEAFSRSSPAASCKRIYNVYSDAPSGYYWIKSSSGSPVQVYCKMNADCTGYAGGWMRVAYIDMKNSSHRCPSGLRLLSQNSNPRSVCDRRDRSRYSSYSCPSTNFTVHGLSYRHVYGRVIAYQYGYPRAFRYNRYNSIDQAYVFGVSLTHGQYPRKHIWTFAGTVDESSNNYRYKCPCINRYMSQSSSHIPSFIGNDYFCDTGLYNNYYWYGQTLYPSDPLWDGQGCGTSNTCCSVSNLCNDSPPWFIKRLPSSTTDNVEMRLCKPGSDGSTPIEVVELYVQ